MKYFLYQHIRSDKNEVFYIGIGTKRMYSYSPNNYSEHYHRAYSKRKRNKIWNDIVKKNNSQYKVEIILESNNYTFIKQEEIRLIAVYGRKCNKTGCLANLTLGGEGTLGLHCDKYINAKRVFVYSVFSGEQLMCFNSTQDAAKELNIDRGNISSCATGKTKHYKQYIFSYTFSERVEPVIIKSGRVVYCSKKNIKGSKVTQRLDNMKNLLEELPSLREFCRKYGYKSSNLCKSIKLNSKMYGFYWKYK